MKKYLLLIVSIIMFASILESYSQSCCPSGYTPVTLNGLVNTASGCEYSITYCYFFLPSGTREVFICDITIDLTQSCSFSNFKLNSSFWVEAMRYVFIDQNIVDEFDECTEVGEPSNVLVNIRKAKCFKVVTDVILDIVKVVPCEEEPGDCVTYYKVCRDGINLITEILSGPTLTGSECNSGANIGILTLGGNCYNSCE